MTATQPVPPGWYADPQLPATLRYWDGVVWTGYTQPTAGQPYGTQPAMAQPQGAQWYATPLSGESHPPQGPAGPKVAALPGFARLALAVQVLVGLSGLGALVSLGFEVWGAGMLQAAADDPGDHRLPLLEMYDSIGLWIASGQLLVLLLAGIAWVVWQHRLAAAVPRGALRRSPTWHVTSWLIPVASLWLPFQNMLDLHRAITPDAAPRRTPRTYLAWWGLWVASSGVQWWSNLVIAGVDVTLTSLSQAAVLTAVAEALTIAATPLAIGIVGALTRSAQRAQPVTRQPLAVSTTWR